MVPPQEEKNGIPRTLVVGGAGFLGSHLCDRFISEGHKVICLDSLLTGRLGNIRHLFSHPHFTFVRHDVTQPGALPTVLGNRPEEFDFLKFDYVLHLASPDSSKDYPNHRLQTLKVGALGCYHTLGLAKRHGSVFLLASTANCNSPANSKGEAHRAPASSASACTKRK